MLELILNLFFVKHEKRPHCLMLFEHSCLAEDKYFEVFESTSGFQSCTGNLCAECVKCKNLNLRTFGFQWQGFLIQRAFAAVVSELVG